jgi:flagellar hook-length control protein FliK
VNGETNGLNLGHGEAEETVSNPALQTIPFPDKAGLASAIALKDDMASAVALNVDGQEPKRVETPLQPTASGVFTAGTAERGAPMRSYQLLDAAMELEWKPTKIFLQKLEPPTEGAQINMPAVTPGEQNSEIAKSVAIENSSLSANVNTGETQPILTTPQDFRLPGNGKTTSSPREFVSVEQGTERNPLFIHNEQLITEPSPHGKTRAAIQNSSQPLTAESPIAPNMPGSTPTAALQSQPAGATSSGNVETWREVVNQVRDGIVTNVEQSHREAYIQLDPPELGKLAIQLVMEGEHIRAHIVAESAEVGALIQSHLPELKQALQSHRLDLDTVRVAVQTGGGDPNLSSRNSHQEEHASHRGRNLSMAQADTRDSETALATPPVTHRDRVNVWA